MHVNTRVTPGPVIAINCPACGAKNVSATTSQQTEVMNLAVRHTTNWVTCGVCGKTLLSKIPVNDLAGKTPEQLDGVVVQNVPLLANVLVILSVLLFWTPLLGQVICLISWLVNRRRRVQGTVSLIALIVGVLLIGGLFVAGLIINSSGHH